MTDSINFARKFNVLFRVKGYSYSINVNVPVGNNLEQVKFAVDKSLIKFKRWLIRKNQSKTGIVLFNVTIKVISNDFKIFDKDGRAEFVEAIKTPLLPFFPKRKSIGVVVYLGNFGDQV